MPHPSCNHSHYETSYGSYTNHGYHASDSGVININQNYQFSFSNPEELENSRIDSNSPEPFDRLQRVNQLFDGSSASQKQPKRRLTNSGAFADPIRSKRQRVEDFVKITLDIAKELADFGNPLTAAVARELEGLRPQLDTLKQNMTTTGDPEETKRRTELISALGEIEKRCHEFLKKGKARRFVDKGRDSGDMARLVEQFREAITHYQISQQQVIYDRIIDLTSSFNTLLKLQEKSPAVKNKLDSVMKRLDRLYSADDSGNEHERWAKLFKTLSLIRDNGNVLYNRINADFYKECDDDIQAVAGIAEDIQEALLDDQISKQRAIYVQNCKLIDAVDLAVLNNSRRALGAAHQHGNRRGCLRGTRETVLKEIESWFKDFNKSPVFWLNGLAGTGKSTIAQTIAERAFADGLLGASFFCSRDFEDRSDLHFIFPTLAFQLAHKFPAFRAHLVPLLQSDPDVVYESLYSQMERLIVEPLRSVENPTVIVIDALDECKDDEPSSAILSVLGRLVEQIPRVKFFITGRPEPRIKTGFRLALLKDATKVFVLHEVHPDLINNDIRLFLRHELSELARRHQLEGWPSDEQISLLCHRAAGLFVYAVATVKFLNSKTLPPERRLDVIVNLPQCTIPEGKTQVKPKTTLDSLYMSVLRMAFSEEDSDVDLNLQSIIGAVVLLFNPLPPSGIAELTNLVLREVILLLTSVQSLLILHEDPTQPVKSFHKSFPDFIVDPSRCVDMRFHISPKNQHLQLAINCLRVLNDGLEQNLLNLPDYALNSEVKDLQTRIDGRISVALRYACQSWHNHLIMSRGDVTDAISRLRCFLEEKFLAWLEVLSVLKATRGAVAALEKLMAWLQEVSRDDQLLDTARGCFYFVINFFEPINVSATHIYHSALELAPLSSIVRRLHYHRRLTPFPSVKFGIPDLRGSSIAIPNHSPGASFTWSPCGQFVAIRTENAMRIRDGLTLGLVSTVQPVTRRNGTISADPPSYSPDGHSLACVTASGITIWDVQTGGVAKQIQSDVEHYPLVWSSDGVVVAVLSSRTVQMYDVASCTALSSIILESDGYSYLWAHNESFLVMRMARDNKATTVDIFEVWPALTKIESFSIQLEQGRRIVTFSPSTYRVSVQGGDGLLIVDIRNLGTLLDEHNWPPFDSFSHSFSSDGSHFAVSVDITIRIWNFNNGRYTPWREIPIGSGGGILFSPTSSSIVTRFDGAFQLWPLDGPPFTPATHRRELKIFSHSGTHIATANYSGDTITITNRLSQTPFEIKTHFEIRGLGLTGNVLLANGLGVVGAWLLTVEGCVSNVPDNRRAGSIWTMKVPRSHRQLKFSVEDETGVIKIGNKHQIYNSTTGVLKPTQKVPRFRGPWYSSDDHLQAQNYCCSSSVDIAPSKDDWEPSNTTWTEGWLKDCQGKCLLWLPIEWKIDWRRNMEWFPDTSIIKFKSRDDKPVVIKLY